MSISGPIAGERQHGPSLKFGVLRLKLCVLGGWSSDGQWRSGSAATGGGGGRTKDIVAILVVLAVEFFGIGGAKVDDPHT